jgi:hypothetical protein
MQIAQIWAGMIVENLLTAQTEANLCANNCNFNVISLRLYPFLLGVFFQNRAISIWLDQHISVFLIKFVILFYIQILNNVLHVILIYNEKTYSNSIFLQRISMFNNINTQLTRGRCNYPRNHLEWI